nr:integrase, catalytic region, zinc finger, CCHC-type, peptidase aspartic, catalytic [Tanacetum cinerariifolium]
MFCVCCVHVEEYQEKNKIGSKLDKNEKRGKAKKSQKQLQSVEEEKLKKMQKEGSEMQTHASFNKDRREQGLDLQFIESYKGRVKSAKVKDKQEKDKSEQNRTKREAWKSPVMYKANHSRESRKKKKIQSSSGVNSRTKMPMVVPISTREPKRTVNQSAVTPLKRTFAVESTNQKPRSTIRHQYEQINKTCKLSYCTVKFGNDQIASIFGYEDLFQGNITIKRVYYVEGLNHNLFSVGQFCDADLEVAFWKSTCYIRDLKGNDLLTASDHVSSDPVPQCSTMALKQGNLSPGPQSQENVPHSAKAVTTSNELDLQFSSMFDELLNGTTQVVSKSSAVTTADAPNQRQQQHITPSTSITVVAHTPH